MKAERRHRLLLAILVTGLVVRLGLAWMPGTEDMYANRMWGAYALRWGLVSVYSLNDQEWLNILFLRLKGIHASVRVVNPTDLGPLGPVAGFAVYPPVNIFASEVSVALCKVLQGGFLKAGPMLNSCMNLVPILFALAIALAVWLFIKKELGIAPVGAIAVFWLHPVFILVSPVLGYTDAMFSFFGLISLMFCFYRRFTGGVLFLVLACLTKPQAVVIIPVVAMAVFAEGRWRALWRYGLRLAFFTLVILLPYTLAGRFLGVFAGVFQNVINPALSAQQLNIWWLLGGVVETSHGGSHAILPDMISMVSRADFQSWAGLHPSWFALPAFFGFTGANLYFLFRELRGGNRWAIFWSAALEVFGFTMLMMYVHEHHLYSFFVYALPLLALGNQGMTRLYWALSFLFGLNLFLFDGLGQGINSHNLGLRMLPGFDLTILLSLVNVMVFAVTLRAIGFRSMSGLRGVRGDPSHPGSS
jgi:hypothetical protein